MLANPSAVRGFLPWFLLAGVAASSRGQPAGGVLSPAQAQALVERALANELRVAQTPGPPMRYQLHKSTPRLTTTKEIVETRDGDVARLISVNGQLLNAAGEQREQARLDALFRSPRQQRHRKQSEDADAARALKVLEALPSAFLYRYVGPAPSAAGMVEKFTFRPNPEFSPPNLETRILTALSGQLWIDPAAGRVTHLEGQLEHDVDFGWGVVGRLNKGGWISIDQADVGDNQWRIVHFQMAITGRLLFRTRAFDTVEVESHFEPVPADLGYREAIQMLRANP